MIPYTELTAITIYVTILFVIAIWSARRHQTASDFIMGGRSLGFWVTAFAAHASDMSAWLFIGLPFLIFSEGLFSAWNAVGLVLFMFLNWLLVAPRIRSETEKYGAYTFSSFFESRFHDTAGLIRIFSALLTLSFYAVYITAGAVGMGITLEILFGFSYVTGMTIGMILTVTYLFFGGYRSLAMIDSFQAVFLMIVIVVVPCVVCSHVGVIMS